MTFLGNQPMNRFVAEGSATGFRLTDEQVAAQDRAELLVQAKQGKIAALTIEANVANTKPNSNHFRFQPDEFAKFAESFTGKPFLRDHERKHEARGGTILQSWAEDDGAGGFTMKQHIKATKGWAIEGLLDETIDRFSIGWSADTKCSVCDDEMELFHKHAPGRRYDEKGERSKDGKLCEAVMVGPKGSETSAVVIPACEGTGVVLGLDEGSSSIYSLGEIFERPEPGRDEGGKMLEKIQKAFGLAGDEDTVLGALMAVHEDATEYRGTLFRITEKLSLPAGTDANGILAALVQLGSPANFVPIAEYKAALETGRMSNAKHRVELLMRDGVFSPAEQEYAVAQCLSDENAFEAWATTKPKSVPIGGSPPPRPTATGGTLTQEESEVNRRMGVTDENYLKQRDEDRKKFGR